MSANRPRSRRSRMCRSVSSYGATGAAPTASRPSSSPSLASCSPCIWEIVPRMKAVRIHEDGGPEVLRYEDAPDPEPGPGEVLIRLRAASLNHLALWLARGPAWGQRPRILGAEGAGVVETGEGLEPGQRIVINPGIVRGRGRI